MADKALRYIPALDGIRGVAIIFVLAHHYGYVRFGWIGLQSFFVLSGFLITSILLTEKNRRVGAYLGRFYWRRLLRTFPAYFGFLVVCAAVYVCVRQPQSFLDVLPSLAKADQFPALQHSWIETPLVVRYSFNWREFGR